MAADLVDQLTHMAILLHVQEDNWRISGTQDLRALE